MFDLNLLNSVLAFKQLTKKELAEAMGINVATFFRKVKKDGNFTREEISIASKILGKENANNIFFADKLAEM